ncbi:MAG: heparinase II/III-family protein, partial [Candidatus Omnitrophica bacterium]|nr:heparinase II/III-family protein [Candidatus Omnitrophota bacterium]
YAARAELDFDLLPSATSYAFKEAGMYALRDMWGPEQIFFALHCSPPAISSHDQEDNGTFELSAYGRWLMNDTGYYTYGHDPEGRRWHRRTAAHQTLTLDGENAEVDGKLLLWQTGSEGDVLTVENPSYDGLVHRRTVWFVDHTFFVLLDEAIGDATGELDLHFQFAPGEWSKDPERDTAYTRYEDANVLVRSIPTHSLVLEEEEGWHAWTYGKRVPRPAFRFRHSEQAPASFLTLVVPYKGETPPDPTAALSADFSTGVDRVSLTATVFGNDWEIGRDLDPPEVWFHSTK